MTEPSFDPQAVSATASQKWDRMTITNDPIFGAVMENQALCQELIQRALPELTIAKLTTVEAQQTVTAGLDTHGVRYDIYGQDAAGRVFEVEMQVLPQEDLALRLRFYQAMIDEKLLHHRERYGELAAHPTYVIFFCNFDYFGKGRARYQFENRDIYDPALPLGDHRHLVIFNATATSFDHAREIRSFLDLMQKNVDTNDEYITRLQAEIERIKADSGRKGTYMKLELDFQRQLAAKEQEGMDKGIEKGKKEGRSEGITAMISLLTDQHKSKAEILATIAQLFHLSVQEAEEAYQQALTS